MQAIKTKRGYKVLNDAMELIAYVSYHPIRGSLQFDWHAADQWGLRILDVKQLIAKMEDEA